METTPDGTKTRTHARRSAPLMANDRDGRGYPHRGVFHPGKPPINRHGVVIF
jgi:hypothetical protein